MTHTKKVWERIIEARLRDRVKINKHQYEFMPGKGTTTQPTMLCRAHMGPARAARTVPVRFGRGRCSGPAWVYRTSFL